MLQIFGSCTGSLHFRSWVFTFPYAEGIIIESPESVPLTPHPQWTHHPDLLKCFGSHFYIESTFICKQYLYQLRLRISYLSHLSAWVAIYSYLKFRLHSSENKLQLIFIMWNSTSWYHFRFNISCGVAVKVRSHQEKFQVIFLWGGKGGRKLFWRGEPIFKVVFIF